MIEFDRPALASYLARCPGLKLAIVFGSAATNTLRADSDIDLAVLMETELDAKRKLDLIGDIAEATGRTVDLVDLRRAGEPLLGQILKGIRLVGSDSDHAELALRHLYANEDFMPYVRRILEERRRSWIG